jgi:hypothetical protein
MKYLIKFNESLDLERIKGNILDILIDFKDRRMAVNVLINNNFLYIIIETVYSADPESGLRPISKPINLSEYLPVFEMLFDYLLYKYELLAIRWSEDDKHHDSYELSPDDNVIETFNEVLKNRELFKIALQFRPSQLTKLQQ